MRPAYPLALLALCSAVPAFATGGIQCRPEKGSGPVLDLVIGHGAGPAVVSASFAGGGQALPVAQSWIDRTYLWVDVTDANATRFEAQLRATFQSRQKGRPAVGTLLRGGRAYRVRCVEN